MYRIFFTYYASYMLCFASFLRSNSFNHRRCQRNCALMSQCPPVNVPRSTALHKLRSVMAFNASSLLCEKDQESFDLPLTDDVKQAWKVVLTKT